MATRRAPTRTRTTTTGPLPSTASASRSKPNSSQILNSSEAIPNFYPTLSNLPLVSQSKPTKPGSNLNSQDDSETSIQVVIRCRRRSEREIQENSPIIASTSGAKGNEITIETAAPISSLGVVTLPPTRTYPFDMVFGPEADQSLIYHEVVSPMLDQVLLGYNCTLFAYGQTGTGKTHTMQGDLVPTPMGNPSPSAGMIPRVLFRLFHQLESSGVDYSVRISFVELYNEELRDLLAPDLPPPTGTAQPMGMGSNKESSGRPELKIFDDSSKKGVFIQGLEECSVKDTTDALALLTKGSQRRQIAATKFNDHSSRSHSIFSITVHTKETSTIGDDLLKVGKMNLVDLAGSENIGRSGAENKRAKEAGMINQSLLTLGRVINSLVDKSSHVPYRESKLTRLLQDSLGGRTKTCLIATISPARSNMEETLSTLDYAIRARSIRNKPEINQRMSRNALLKEYVAEIERLKADVLATREKNGIFFSEETWTKMNAEAELKETEMVEARRQVEVVESQLRNVREEFEQSIALLMKRDGQLKETKEKLQETEQELDAKTGQLTEAKGALQEEIVVRQAYQDNEVVLDGVATGLKHVAKQTINDLGKVFGKLERKAAVFSSNSHTVSTHTRTITNETRAFSSKFEDYVKSSMNQANQFKTDAELYRNKEVEALASVSARLNDQLEKIRQALKAIHSKDQVAEEAAVTIRTAVEESQESMKTSFAKWTEELQRHVESTCKQVEASTIDSCAIAEVAFKSLGSMAELIFQEAQDFVASERKTLLDSKSLSESNTSAEISRLQYQNNLLSRLLTSEKVKSEKAKDELIKRISGLLGDFTAERDRSLRESFIEMSNSNKSGEEGMIKLGKQQAQKLDSAIANGKEWSGAIEKRRSDLKRTRDGGAKAIEDASNTFREGAAKLRTSVVGETKTFSEDLTRRTRAFSTTFSGAYDQMSRAKRARVENTESMATEAQSTYRYLQRNVASTSRNIETYTGHVSSEAGSLSIALEGQHASGTSHLNTIRSTAQALAEQGMREDIPTGMTPRKRTWEYTDHWSSTNREAVLADWRKRSSSVSSATSQGEGFAFKTEYPSLPSSGGSQSESESTGMISEDDRDPEEEFIDSSEHQDDTIRLKSPPVSMKPLASSTSSTSSSSTAYSTTVTELRRPKPIKSSIPTAGLLTERSANLIGTRGPRRTRR